MENIKKVFELNKGRYGYRRITIALNKLPEYKNNPINHKKVLKLMRLLGLKCKTSNVSRYNSYKGQVGKTVKNLLLNKVVDEETHKTFYERNFEVSKMNEVWCTDVTEFKFNDLKLKAMSPELREWVRFHNLSGGEQLVETVNDPDFIGTPNKEDKSKEAVEMDFFIMTYIKDFKAIYDYYDKMLQCFALYEDCMKSNPTDCSAAFTGVDVALDELNHKDFDEVFARHKIAQPYENCVAFRKAIENIKTKSVVRLDQIAKSMRTIQDWYEKLDASGKKTASDEVKARAREFIKSVKDRYKMIQDTSTKIIDEIDRLIHLEFKIEESIAVLRVQHKAISSQNKSKKRGK